MRTTLTIHKASAYFRVAGFHQEFERKVIKPFCRKHLYKFTMVQTDPPSRKKVWKVSHVFARSNYDQTEYRLPHSLLKEFISFAEYMGYNPARFKILDESVIKGTPVQFKLKKEFSTPRPHQKEWIEYQLREGGIKANNAATGVGKLQPLYSSRFSS